MSDRIHTRKPKPDVFPRPHCHVAVPRGLETHRDHDIPDGDSDATRSSRKSVPHFQFSRVAVFSSDERQSLEAPSERAPHPQQAALSPPVKAKLEVGSVADSLEKDADATADRVMGTPARAGLVGEPIRTGRADSAAAPHSVYDVLQSPGEALDAGVRAFMEPRFGHDFSQVRVHRDMRAAESAEAVRARAYTLGPHVVFGAASYSPVTADGRRLIAHELSHVAQQRRGPGLVIQRQLAEDWNFTRADYAKLTGSGQKKLMIAQDSTWFPAKLQQNLLNTLDLVLGPAISPPATEGVNASDFFHGHLVVKKDPATAAQTAAAEAQGQKLASDLKRERTAALGKDVRFESVGPAPKYAITSGYPFVTDAKGSAEQKIAAYKGAVEKVEPSLGQLMENAAKIPGAAVMYHTFEFNQPADLAAKGQKLDKDSPRRNYVTPLDTNRPMPYTTQTGATYEKEYTVIAPFSFLVDKTGAVHVRPFDPGSTGFTSLELSTITGKPFAKSPGFER